MVKDTITDKANTSKITTTRDISTTTDLAETAIVTGLIMGAEEDLTRTTIEFNKTTTPIGIL